MKTLTTLTAVVALIAGISVASAQSSTMGKDKMMGPAQQSAQIKGSGKFCLKGPSGALDCQYASLAACQSANKGKTCESNPQSGTTGAGSPAK